jgi:hypothetical protein
MTTRITETFQDYPLVPLSQRRFDWFIITFFLLNLFFITYIVDLEQLVVADPHNFDYPVWPPTFFVDIIHNYGRTFDPVLIARPPWWRATIWIDVLFFGPFYAAAIYAFVRGKNWIRIPCFIWSGMMFSNVTIIMAEELFGPHATPQPLVVLLLNLPWWTMPAVISYRMWRKPLPFNR